MKPKASLYFKGFHLKTKDLGAFKAWRLLEIQGHGVSREKVSGFSSYGRCVKC